ncbi:MAG: hypothetical protein A2284_11570 [Deltaproteobacteria bacterium RIFOXYA12_FULL_61_11]|nr:MAG: hypothetical protein A2284_11570 [Deltaproteobacteria bacterium RIFOXYA12_FULL_61_11]
MEMELQRQFDCRELLYQTSYRRSGARILTVLAMEKTTEVAERYPSMGVLIRGFGILLFLSACGVEEGQLGAPAGTNLPRERPGLVAGETEIAPDPTEELATPPTSRVPCEVGRCWLNAPEIRGACPDRPLGEDFSSGKYNVHRYPYVAPAGTSVEVTLEVTAGQWQPILIVADAADGITLFDGEVGLSGGAVQLETGATGRTGSLASVLVTAATETRLDLYVTSWETVDSGFTAALATEARYTLSTSAGCPPPTEICPMDPQSIDRLASGFFTAAESSDPLAPNYSPYKRDDRDSHSGYDLHAPMGIPVLATQDGVIVSATTVDASDCGRSVTLEIPSGVRFRYCHLDQVLVTSGEVVAGQVIGLNGATGNAHVSHVHFVYLESPALADTSSGEVKSRKVNQYIDDLCR